MALRPVSHKDLRSILAIFVRHCRHTMASFGQLKAQFRDPVNGYQFMSCRMVRTCIRKCWAVGCPRCMRAT